MTALRGEPAIAERAAQPYVGMRKVVTMDTVAEVADRIPVLVAWLAERGHATAGAPFLRYHVIDMEAELDLEAGVPVTAPLPVEGDVLAGELPAGRYVSYRHVGHPQELLAVTAGVIGWTENRGLSLDSTRTDAGERWTSRLEVFHSNPMEVPDPADWETEVAMRIADGARNDR